MEHFFHYLFEPGLMSSGPVRVALLVGTVILVGALTFLPALALGPMVEHFLMLKGTLF